LIDINDNQFFQCKKDIEEHCQSELKKGYLIIAKYTSGSITKIYTAKRGNSSYANLVQNRMDNAVRQIKKQLEEKGGSILQITLTGKYDIEDIEDIFNSWERMKNKYWAPFYRWLKRKGFSSYISTNEAHEKGGCHTNLIIYHKNELEAVIDKKRISRLVDKILERKIKECWRRCGGGNANVQVVDNLSAVTGYINKDIGRESHIEGALNRSMRNWQKKSDKEKQSADIKKLWGWYIANKLKLRRWNMSRDLKVEALGKVIRVNSIEIINNEKKDKITDWFFIPKADTKKGVFTEKPGKIEENTPEYKRAMYYFNNYPQQHRLPQSVREREFEQTRKKIVKRLNERKKKREVI